MKPRLFIGSSVENLSIANAVQELLEHDAETTVWTQGLFELSRYSLESLLDSLDEVDFGVFVFAPDDITKIRGTEYSTARDNVVFELGMFIGRLGRESSFIVIPRGEEKFHLPTDLLGITPAMFEPNRTDKNLIAALGPACTKIRRSISKFKPATSVVQVSTVPPIEPSKFNSEDYINIIQSWMGQRKSSSNLGVFIYADVDRELKLPPGTAEKYIVTAAAHWNYTPKRKGAGTILFDN